MVGGLHSTGLVKNIHLLAILLSALFMGGCSAVTSGIKADMAGNLSDAMVNSDDPETVAAAAPAYLLMVDGFLRGEPENEDLLMAGAKLYTTYAGVFVKDKARAKRLTQRALDYAFKALCVNDSDFCELGKMDFESFKGRLNKAGKGHLKPLYTLGAAWGGWIQAHSDDLSAVARISRIEEIMNRVVALDEGFDDGGAHMYLGVMATLIPPALGGKPEKGRAHFERALELSRGKNLMIKVVFAKQYARLVFDRELHDRLLKEVADAKGDIEGFRLVNRLAKGQAADLLSDADDYF